jgi:ribosome biogenesis GTPase
MKLEDLGLSDWFKKKVQTPLQVEYSLARVTAVNKDNFLIRNERTEIPAEVTGKLMYGAESNLELPAVGDWVYVQYFDDATHAIIHNLLPRKSLLKRKVAGKKIEYQPIASNIDVVFIVQSTDFDFNLRRLERYLIMVNESHIKPAILLSKSDLIPAEDLEKQISVLAVKLSPSVIKLVKDWRIFKEYSHVAKRIVFWDHLGWEKQL